METASLWLVGPGHKMAGCGALVVEGLMLAHWQAELGSEVGGCGPNFLDLALACWWVGPAPSGLAVGSTLPHSWCWPSG